ncbi:MAG: penicillin-binding protein 1C [Fusobacterium gastrosuis]|uniref:penicillin-binding protein 1C n=1 Tax=Fusobacterium gastrosuis TaxID=1755100 RepID=UPI002A8E0691|nr:penicillin-binding protein 1C [Fusobacterium gastrosuis]MDY5795821.1 penicillin-binding protein 1C [Fusobacterium gastrosuis]
MLRKIKLKYFFIFFIVFLFLFSLFLLKIYSSYKPKELMKKIDYSQVVYDRNGTILTAFLNKDEQWHIKSENEIPEILKEAVIFYEDKKFYKHSGIDYLRIVKSLFNNLTGGKKMGASTISMQVVKLLEPAKRTYLNKIIELAKVKKLESELTKDEILRLYLNNVPYGSNIIGYSTAIKLYFNKEVQDLSYGEASLLAILPNSPGILNLKKNNEKLLEKRNFLLKRMADKKIIGQQQLKFALLEKLPTKIHYFENKTPQFSYFIKNKYIDKNITTTLDYKLHFKIENLVRDYSNNMKQIGINNAAALIIDNKTNEVLAYVASQNYKDKKNHSEIDGLQIKRSPASLLKPFLYALSIDDGLISSESLYPDVPIYFNNFYPKNSDNKFRGMVRIEEALIKSLNIPFIKLLEDYKVDRFFYFLENIDKYGDDNFNKYGLSLILGTREMKAVDIAKLYVGLANYGKFSDLKYIVNTNINKNFSDNKESKLISSGASYLTLETLSKVVRPDNEKLYSDEKPISWKTGTSFGLRDAWAVGVSPDYTILVWLGNFSNKPISTLSGVNTAGNLLFKIFNIVELKPKSFAKPNDNLKQIEIDEKTGYRKFYDIESKFIEYPKEAKLLRISPYLKKIFVDKNNKIIDSRNENFIDAKEKIILEYPVEVANYYYENSPDVGINRDVKIAYPTNNLSITLPKDFSGYQKLSIKLYNPNKEFLYWYLDNKYIGFLNDEEKLFDLEAGQHKFTIVTADGKRDEVNFKILKK